MSMFRLILPLGILWALAKLFPPWVKEVDVEDGD